MKGENKKLWSWNKKNKIIMKVSIITSCYNREKTICGAVESVLAQDYPDIEYIIVDGASKDQSAQIIREAIAGHEDKVKFLSLSQTMV